MEEGALNRARREHEQGSFAFGGERNALLYKHYLGVDLDSFIGKTVLNIGGGPSGAFEKEAIKKGVKMFSISPDYKWGVSEDMKDQAFSENQTHQVAARAQAIPFADETFDCELALFTVPMYLPPIAEEHERYLKEIVRTLKHGGTAYIYPMTYDRNIDPKLTKNILDSLASEITYSSRFGHLNITRR